MSINIFNQFQSPQQAEDLIPSLSKLNLNNKKDLAFNYYFGERQGGGKNDPQANPQQSKFYDIHQPNKPNFPKEDFISQQKKPQKALQLQHQQQTIFKNDMINPQGKNMMINPLLADNSDIRRKNIVNSNSTNINSNNNTNFNQMQFMQKQPHQ